jgi:monoamine oxidase
LHGAGDAIWEARALTARGMVHLALNATGRADADFGAAECLFAATSQELERAYARHNRGLAAFRSGDLPAGLSHLDEAARRYGGPAEEQSALNLIYLLGLYDSSPSGLQPRRQPQLSGTDEKWHIRGGNDQLISGLVGRLPAGTVRLGERLIALRGRGHGRYACAFASGLRTREVHADHVVLALPFTKLREVELQGIELPPPQLRAIRHEPLGSNSKIQLQFSSRIWNADGWTGNLYTDRIVQGGWETTIDQPGKPGILVALPGGAGGADIGRRYALTSYDGPAPAAMAADFLDCFETDFPGVRAAFNGKAFYAWSSGDPHIGGAYSYLKVGQYTAFNGIQGRRHGNLHFGGEHTSVNFQGYMEGALRSGYRCATEVAGRPSG